MLRDSLDWARRYRPKIWSRWPANSPRSPMTSPPLRCGSSRRSVTRLCSSVPTRLRCCTPFLSSPTSRPQSTCPAFGLVLRPDPLSAGRGTGSEVPSMWRGGCAPSQGLKRGGEALPGPAGPGLTAVASRGPRRCWRYCPRCTYWVEMKKSLPRASAGRWRRSVGARQSEAMFGHEVENHFLGDRPHVEHAHHPEIWRELVLVGHSVAAVNCDRGVKRLQTGRGPQVLRHVRQLAHLSAAVIELACPVGHQLGGLQMNVRGRQRMGNRLMRTDRLPPHPPLIGIGNRLAHGVASDPGADRTRQDPLGVESGESHCEPVVLV